MANLKLWSSNPPIRLNLTLTRLYFLFSLFSHCFLKKTVFVFGANSLFQVDKIFVVKSQDKPFISSVETESSRSNLQSESPSVCLGSSPIQPNPPSPPLLHYRLRASNRGVCPFQCCELCPSFYLPP